MLEFYYAFLLRFETLQKISPETKSWSKILQIGVNKNSAMLYWKVLNAVEYLAIRNLWICVKQVQNVFKYK